MKNKTKIKPLPGKTPLSELADKIAQMAVRNLRYHTAETEEERKKVLKDFAYLEKTKSK